MKVDKKVSRMKSRRVADIQRVRKAMIRAGRKDHEKRASVRKERKTYGEHKCGGKGGTLTLGGYYDNKKTDTRR